MTVNITGNEIRCPDCGFPLTFENEGIITFRYVCPNCGKHWQKFMGD
jgi:predicted RNA-binding Zn-ribbon protein involved in translation (DUF1610 family)